MNVTAFPKPEKQWRRDDWEDFYADAQNFAKLFSNFTRLRDRAKVTTLSSSQQAHLSVCEAMIDGKFS